MKSWNPVPIDERARCLGQAVAQEGVEPSRRQAAVFETTVFTTYTTELIAVREEGVEPSHAASKTASLPLADSRAERKERESNPQNLAVYTVFETGALTNRRAFPISPARVQKLTGGYAYQTPGV